MLLADAVRCVRIIPEGERTRVREGFTDEMQPFLSAKLLTNLLDAADQESEVARLTGLDSYIHVSSLIGMCPRQATLARIYSTGQRAYRSTSGYDRIVWAIGRSVERHIRDTLITKFGQTNVFGGWTCPGKHEIIWGTFPSNAPLCPQCRLQRNVYVEADLKDDELGITGHPDLIVIINGWMVVVEIKSMTSVDWNKLTAPKGDHVFQAGSYRHLLARKGFRVHRNVIVIVATKDYSFKRSVSPYKEFHMDVTVTQMQTMFDRAFEQAAMVKSAALAQVPPPRDPSVCSGIGSTTANACPHAHICFSLPGGH